MDAQKRQQALDSITPEELEKIQAHQAKTQGALPVDNEWLLLVEFGKAFGWEAYQAAKNDEIELTEMMTMIEASRKLEYLDMFNMAQAFFAGAGSAMSSKPTQTFTAMTKVIIEKTKVQ